MWLWLHLHWLQCERASKTGIFLPKLMMVIYWETLNLTWCFIHQKYSNRLNFHGIGWLYDWFRNKQIIQDQSWDSNCGTACSTTIQDFILPPSANSRSLVRISTSPAFNLPFRFPLRTSCARRIFSYRIDLPPVVMPVAVAATAPAVARAHLELELVARRRRHLSAFLVGGAAEERLLRRHLTRRSSMTQTNWHMRLYEKVSQRMFAERPLAAAKQSWVYRSSCSCFTF